MVPFVEMFLHVFKYVLDLHHLESAVFSISRISLDFQARGGEIFGKNEAVGVVHRKKFGREGSLLHSFRDFFMLVCLDATSCLIVGFDSSIIYCDCLILKYGHGFFSLLEAEKFHQKCSI